MAELRRRLGTPGTHPPRAPKVAQDASPRRCRVGCWWLWEAAEPSRRPEGPHPAPARGTGRGQAKPGQRVFAFWLSPCALRPGEHGAARLPATGQSWSRARAGGTDIPIRTTAAGPRRDFGHGRVPASELRFPTGGCLGGIYRQSPTATAPAKALGRPGAGDLPAPHACRHEHRGRRWDRGRGRGRPHGSSADSRGLPGLTQQLGVPGPASVAAALPAAWRGPPVPPGTRAPAAWQGRPRLNR